MGDIGVGCGVGHGDGWYRGKIDPPLPLLRQTNCRPVLSLPPPSLPGWRLALPFQRQADQAQITVGHISKAPEGHLGLRQVQPEWKVACCYLNYQRQDE